jgi:hypothetical protein
LKTSMRVVSLAVILAIAGFAGLAIHYSAKNQPNRGVALEDLHQLFRPEAKPLGAIVVKTYHEFRGNAVRWSAVYFGCLFGSAFLSAFAALILKLELLGDHLKLKNDLAALLATLAALLVTLSTTGDFQQKWQANRIAAAEMENFAYELARPSAATNLDAILTRIQTINSARNRMIIGELAESINKELPLAPSSAQPGAAGDAHNPARP